MTDKFPYFIEQSDIFQYDNAHPGFIRSRVEYPVLQGESSNLRKTAGLRPGSTMNFLANDDTPSFRAGSVMPEFNK
jgi:hypothetical protein